MAPRPLFPAETLLLHCILAFAILSQVKGQDITVLRPLGARTLPDPSNRSRGAIWLESEELWRLSAQQRQAGPHFVQVQDNDGAPVPWWEEAEGTALQSMQTKRFRWNISLQAGWEYDDNLFLGDRDSQGGNSFSLQIPVTAVYEGGKISFSAAYSPEYRYYDVEGIEDSFNQGLSAGVAFAGSRSSAALDVSFAQTDGSNVEIGDRVDAITMITTLRGTYKISPKTALGINGSWSHMDYDQFNSYDSYTAKIAADYEVSPKTALGLEAGYEITDVALGAGSEAFSVSGRASWQASEKLAVRGSAGYEWREFEESESLSSPVFSIGLLAMPRDGTSISLDVYRRNMPSVSLINQNFYSTGAVVTLTHAVRSRLRISVSGGYEFSKYNASASSVTASREDSYWYIRPQASLTIGQHASLSVFYQYSSNDSSGTDGRDFERNLIGASLSLAF